MNGSNDANTVFVRGLPTDVVRVELEELFSGIGPVKKCSVIRGTASGDSNKVGLGFGFVRFTTPSDARIAAKEMNGIVTERGGRKWKLMVEVADESKKGGDKGRKRTREEKKKEDSDDDVEKGGEEEEIRSLKKTNRVIIRNLSFYAKESHVRSTLGSFGEIVEFTLPTVSGDSVGAKRKQQHRGFCFATFKTQA
eukprot:CAMPEP_0118659988 /NCGR_PEP_ID=MMETSP0785-20121206/15414_1 /TAXON_ID=91992 /ORGANISM="Bolidomonas pacifica, Strain CCMP 1866" /LENGTH=194 /DNA_ID=CAMNT_0006553147 /DNA_START=64 /DNA_END=645 /DNA_ORIENTATION=-